MAVEIVFGPFTVTRCCSVCDFFQGRLRTEHGALLKPKCCPWCRGLMVRRIGQFKYRKTDKWWWLRPRREVIGFERYGEPLVPGP